MKLQIHENFSDHIVGISKKIFLTAVFVLASFAYAQDSYNSYPSAYNGYEYYDNSYDYPEDYYYNYPTDYYPEQYYQGYYEDYKTAVYSIDWDQFFFQNHLTPYQIDQIVVLNNRFASYDAWNSYYRWNPDRWYYDRFYALQNILGSRIFVTYQNAYFRGSSPFVFYRSRFNNFYARKYPVRTMYRNVNVNTYRINRSNFAGGFRSSGRNYNVITTNRNDGIRTQNVRSGTNGNKTSGMRNSQNMGMRSQSIIGTRSTNSGMRSQQVSGGMRNSQNMGMRSQSIIGTRSANSGMRSQQVNGGMRSDNNSGIRSQNTSRDYNSGNSRINNNRNVPSQGMRSESIRSQNTGTRQNENNNQRNSSPLRSQSGFRNSGVRSISG